MIIQISIAERDALIEALDQYVANTDEALDLYLPEELGEERLRQQLELARGLLDLLNAARAQLADEDVP